MPKLINWELARNPLNWIVVFLMVAFAAFLWGLVDPLNTQTQNVQGSPP